MNNGIYEDKFDFSEEVQEKLIIAFKNFVKTSKDNAANFIISERRKRLVILSFVNNVTESILEQNEKDQNVTYTEEEKKYFKNKIMGLLLNVMI